MNVGAWPNAYRFVDTEYGADVYGLDDAAIAAGGKASASTATISRPVRPNMSPPARSGGFPQSGYGKPRTAGDRADPTDINTCRGRDRRRDSSALAGRPG